MKIKLIDNITDFGKGFIAGFILTAIIFCFVTVLMYRHIKDKKHADYVREYAEKQTEVQELREDYINRDPVEFLEVPGVRRAADGAAADFDRNLDEILRAFRQRRNAW